MTALEDWSPTDERRLSVVAPPPPDPLPDPQLAPPEQLRALLRHYKACAVPFDAAWELAWGLIVWPPSRREASDWRFALDSDKIREGWRASYCDWVALTWEVAVGELSRILSDEARDDVAA